MRVAHLSSVHRPFDGRIFHKECGTLARAGYDVVLIVPHDRDVRQEVRVRAVRKPGNRWDRMTRTAWYILRAALAERAQLYHIHDPELIPLGVVLKLRGARVVYDAHEDLRRQVLIKGWIPRSLRQLVAGLAAAAERVASLLFDSVVAATPVIARRFLARKAVVVQNFPVAADRSRARPVAYSERRPLVVYLGGIKVITGIREAVQALDTIPARFQARLALAGYFDPPELEGKLSGLAGWGRVDFLGWLSPDAVQELLGRARLGLVTLHPTPNYTDAQPTKLFEYMSAGIPVIASDFPLWRRIVDGAGSGLLVDPQDPRAIAEAIQWILEHPQDAEVMGRQGRDAIDRRYNWETEGRRLIRLYDRLLA